MTPPLEWPVAVPVYAPGPDEPVCRICWPNPGQACLEGCCPSCTGGELVPVSRLRRYVEQVGSSLGLVAGDPLSW
jgi:hypothetical protein